MAARAQFAAIVALVGLVSIAGCAQPAAKTTLNPLWSGSAGTGAYPLNPAELELPAPDAAAQRKRCEKPPPPTADKPCVHAWVDIRESTHSYMDPLSGMPALCTPHVCEKCGAVWHECQGRRPR